MIFAAGLGSRLFPLTKNKPKALVEFRGKPLLEHCILYLKSHGINELVINVHHFAGQIIDFLKQRKNFDISIIISDESEALLETGGGLKKASPFFSENENFIAINVDVLTNLNLSKLIHNHKNNKSLATLVVRNRQTSRYLLFSNNFELAGWKNIRSGEVRMSKQIDNVEQYAFSGIQAINSNIFEKIEEEGKFSIIDVFLRLASSEKIAGYNHSSGYWFDLGKPESIDKANRLIPDIDY